MAAQRRGLVFRVAEEPWELEQVYRLNYRTFVEEIPQHSPNPQRRLADRLLAGSTCYLCLEGERVLGMVAISDRRPFSLDAKLPDLDRYLTPGCRPCEIRLLAVERQRRGGIIFAGLLGQLVRHSRERGYDLALVSAAARQERLYRHIGFLPFGPRLGSPEAPFQGMYLTWDRLHPTALALAGKGSPAAGAGLDESEPGDGGVGEGEGRPCR